MIRGIGSTVDLMLNWLNLFLLVYSYPMHVIPTFESWLLPCIFPVAYARDHQPCIIFMDEIDAIGGRRFSEGTSADREIQRTLMELLNQMDGFDKLGQVKMIMATNRPDVLDPALLRPGRLDRKIEIPLPNEQARLDILKIHAKPITKKGDIGKYNKTLP